MQILSNPISTLNVRESPKIFASFRNTMVTSDFRPEVEIRPFRACVMHPAIIIGTVRSLWMWLWGRYHVPQNVFLVLYILSTICRGCSMPPLVWLWTYDPATTYHRPSGNCTGYRSTRGSTTSCACWSTRRRSSRLRRTSPTC